MKTTDLARRSLIHYWRTHLAVLMGVVAATAVIGGALLVGDSVRDSLRQMSLDRLGGVDHALVGHRFFRQQLADDLLTVARSTTELTIAPAVVLQAGAIHENDGTTRRAAGVHVYAADERLWSIWEADGGADGLAPPEADDVVLNRRVASALGVDVGDEVSLLIEIPAAIPRDTLLGDRNETVTELPLTVSGVAEDETTPGRFGLNPAQQLPLNAFCNLGTLQRQLGMQYVPATKRNPDEKPARINALFVAENEDDPSGAAELTEAVSDHVTLSDLSLRLIPYEEQGYVSLESEQMILEDAIGSAAARVAEEMELVASPVLVYLLDEIASPADPEKFSMYTVVAGIDFTRPSPFGPLEFVIGGPPTDPGEVVINDWLAKDLGITAVGEEISITHKMVGDRGELPDVERTWTVTGILKLTGPVADPHYTPYVEGITDADDVANWREPYPMDQERVTNRDHDFWEEHKTTPKLFLAQDEAERLFASRYGKLTSFRFAPADDRTLDEVSAEFESKLLEKLTAGPHPASGMVFQPVRRQGLEAASGTTDFTGLFIGFSFFLIAAALLLIGLLFRLGIERRVTEYGLLSAVGLSPRDVRRLFLTEVALITLIGGLLGCAAAVGYAGLMIHGLKTWWFGAIGTKFLFLSVRPRSLLGGFVIAVVTSLLTAWWTLWRMRNVPTRQMLSGLSEAPLQGNTLQERGRWARSTAMTSGAIAAVLLVATLSGLVPAYEAFGGFSWRVVTFFLVGIASLVGTLSLLAWRLDAGESSQSTLSDVVNLGFRNAARHRGRSVLTASLIASATFVIVAVAAGRRNPAVERPVNNSGNGGFTLVAEASTPVRHDLNRSRGRIDAGFDVAETELNRLIESMRMMPFRVRPGEDASCLNLYQTQLPTILGVPEDVLQAMIDEDRFKFADTPGDDPWTRLEEELPEGRVPVLGDMNTLMYSLHKGIGETLEAPTAAGAPAVLEVAGMFDGSVFQGVLLMSETHFHELFPDRDGFEYFLIEIDPSQSDELSVLLETQLADYGFDVTHVADRLADFLAVQNTYLSTFQTLGGLGLLLGTLGLGTVMLRNVLERRGEFALLRAVGLRNGSVTKMVLAENAFLLLWGLASGALSALLAMGPHLMTTGADVPWGGLQVMLLSVFTVGMLAALAAVWEAVRTPILATLRSE